VKITALKQQEKHKDRYSVFVEGKYAFSLSESALLASGLASGQELDGAGLQAYKQQSTDDKIYGVALRYATMRMRSEWEMRTYLQRKRCSPDLANSILNKLTNIGLISDQKFASTWVEMRSLLRPTSKRKLEQELRAKHVSSDVIRTAITAGEPDDHAAIQALIEKKRRQSKYASDPLKLMQYLARQGFGYDDIKAALSSTDNDK